MAQKHKVRDAHVCLEATGRYGEVVAIYLHARGYAVSVVNPARQDARVIAHFCATQTPKLWTSPTPVVQELQALSCRLKTLKINRTRELNRQQSGLTSETVLAAIAAHIAFLDEQITTIEQRMRDLINQDPELRQQYELLLSIPDIGNITAANFLAEVPDITRFDSASQLAAYAGLTPRRHESGSSIHLRRRLVKAGNVHFRTAFFMPALVAMRYNPIIKALVVRLEARGKCRMSIVGATMRKLVHLAFGVLKHQQPFDPDYLVNLQVVSWLSTWYLRGIFS